MLHREHELSVFDKPCGDFLDQRFIVLDIVEGEGAEDDVKGCISKVQILHFPVDHYYYEGKRDAVFLGEHVTKYHRTLTTYLQILLQNGFSILDVIEPMPPEDMMDLPGMKDEMRRPMMLLISAQKQADR